MINKKSIRIFTHWPLWVCILPLLYLGSKWYPLANFKQVELHGTQYTTTEELNAALSPFYARSTWWLRLSPVHHAIKSCPWVSTVQVSRHGSWHTLRIDIKEKKVEARLNQDLFLDDQGQVITPYSPPGTVDAPQVNCPLADVAMAHRLLHILSARTASLSLTVSGVEKTADDFWQATLSDHTLLILGSEHMMERAESIEEIMHYLKDHQVTFHRLDLRYSSGFAVA